MYIPVAGRGRVSQSGTMETRQLENSSRGTVAPYRLKHSSSARRRHAQKKRIRRFGHLRERERVVAHRLVTISER